MLTHLTIKNYALIKQLELAPSAHLNVITGETGAGKSIMLGAIGLLLGNRADSKTLWDETEKCVTEGAFKLTGSKLKQVFEDADLDFQEHTIIRREISATGKSRAFINDTPVTLEVMRAIGAHLMDVHSQHETLELADKHFQLELVDLFAGNHELLSEYLRSFKDFQRANKEYESLLAEATKIKQESDFINFQLKELNEANLAIDEQEKLEASLNILENAESIKTQLQFVLGLLSTSEFSVSTNLSALRSHFQALSVFGDQFQELAKRTDSVRIELNDIIDEIEKENERVDVDPQRTEHVKERLSVIYHLQQKHKLTTIADLLKLQDTLAQQADKALNLDDLIAKTKNQVVRTKQVIESLGKTLSQTRQKVFSPLSKKIITLLQDLGIPDAQLAVDHRTTDPGITGMDAIELLFSANKGIPPRPLAAVASGGEFSRLMFAIKYVMAEKTSLPTLILDEIDTGVSGEISIQLGRMMKEMSTRHQIIAISHLPQIAAKADEHYFVFKDNSEAKTTSSIRRLTAQERVEEVAKMIGGATPSPITLKNARELIGK